MNVDRMLGLLGLFLGVLPYVALGFRWRLSRHPARTFLGLRKDQPVEVIVSTNSTRAATAGEARALTTAIGELRSVAVGARTVLRLYKHKKVSVFMSAEYPGRLQADTLILGGPLRNSYAQRFLDYVNDTYPEAELRLDAPAGVLGVGGRTIRFDQQRDGGIPREDLALLVLATVPGNDSSSQRFVFCAGLSTYGTEGAARLLFQQVLSHTREGVRLRRLLSGAVAAVLVHVWIEGRQVIRTELHEDYSWSAAKVRRRPQPAVTPAQPTPAP
jgi:hypothetical protein